MKKTARYLLALLALTVAVVLTGCANSTVASVNGEKITRSELQSRVDKAKKSMEESGMSFSGSKGQDLLKNLEKDTLNQMIDEKLIMQEAKKEGLLPTAKEIDDHIKLIKNSYPSEDAFKKELAKYQLTENDLKDYLRVQIAQQKLMDKVTKGVQVTTADALKYYNDHKDLYQEPEKVQAKHILIAVGDGKSGPIKVKRSDAEAKKIAEDVIAQLNKGADFAALAKKYSDDLSTKDKGGELGAFTREDMVPQFSQAAFSLPAGQYTKSPVKTQYGYHIIFVEKHIPARQIPFDQVKDTLLSRLTDQAKEQKFNDYLSELRKKADIVNKLEPANKPAK